MYSNLLYSFCRSLKSRSTTDKIRLHSSSFKTDNSDARELNDFASKINFTFIFYIINNLPDSDTLRFRAMIMILPTKIH
jgi:hypothetical protein